MLIFFYFQISNEKYYHKVIFCKDILYLFIFFINIFNIINIINIFIINFIINIFINIFINILYKYFYIPINFSSFLLACGNYAAQKIER